MDTVHKGISFKVKQPHIKGKDNFICSLTDKIVCKDIRYIKTSIY